MNLVRLALASAWNRRWTLALTVIAVALAVLLLLGVERVRGAARASFAASVSGTDLVVGARSGPIQLMLLAIFRLGNASANMSWKSYETIAADPGVAWSVPISLGDSHRGFPVVGTTSAYFERFRYGRSIALAFAAGKPFVGVFDAVLGAEVAARLRLQVGDRIILSHGTSLAGPEHGDKPFTVVGVLERTGTPVDRSVHVSLEGIEAIHLGWQAGMPPPGFAIPAELVKKFDLSPKSITAALVGLKSRAAVFEAQRRFNGHAEEALSAVMPGIALDELWDTLDAAERALSALAILVVLVSLAGLVAVLLAGLGERRRELAILRSVGAGPRAIVGLVIAEMLIVTFVGAIIGLAGLSLVCVAAGPAIAAYAGLSVLPVLPSAAEWIALAAVLIVGALAGLLPALRALRYSLADGLTPRL